MIKCNFYLTAVFQLIGSITFAMGTIAACKMLHEGMLERMMSNPMSFFDTTPIGRIVNRFAKDVDVVDNTLPMTLRTALICFLAVCSFLYTSYNSSFYYILKKKTKIYPLLGSCYCHRHRSRISHFLCCCRSHWCSLLLDSSNNMLKIRFFFFNS